MKRRAERVFLGAYFDAFEVKWLLFVAKEDCDREAEFRKAYMKQYGRSSEDILILRVSLVSSLCESGVAKGHRVHLVEK